MDKEIKVKLTPKQLKFCQEYLIDFNATQAAIRAGYSAKTAQQQSADLLLKPVIQTKISELMAKRDQRLEKSADEVLRRVWEVADLRVAQDAGSVSGGEFQLTDSANWTESTKRVVRSIKSTRTIRRIGKEEIETIESSVKAPEVMPALVELMKHHGLTNDFNQAIACLRKYGLVVKQDEDGKWKLEDLNV